MIKKKVLTQEQIAEKLDYLRKQRDGLIVGDYRNYLYNLYMYLKERCSETEDGSCNPYPWQMLVALGRDDLHKSYLGYTYCDDLEALGYIKMQGNGKDKKIFIIKDIDF